MNKEEKLKNILEELQDTVKYPILWVQTMDGTDEEEMDNDIYLEVDKCEILLDYIEQLQQENKQLKINCNIGNENLKFYQQENKQLKEKIDKVIEEIDTTSILLPTEYGDEFASFKRKLMKILKW